MIGARLSALKGTKWYEHALRFGFGGVCTVLAGLIAKKFGPVVGGMFLAFPAIFPAGANMIETHEKEKKREVGSDGERRGRIAAGIDAEGSALGAVALAGFGLVVWRWLPRMQPVAGIATAVAAWVAVATVLWALYRVRWVERWRRRGRSG